MGRCSSKVRNVAVISALIILVGIAYGIDMDGERVKNVATPTASTDAATKQYVDDTAAAEGHNFLSTAHGDTTSQAVTRGSLIYGNSDPNWDELVLGASGTILRSDGTDCSWSATTNITALGTIATGTWQATDIGIAYGGTGASTLNDLITLATHTTGNYVATVADAGSSTMTVSGSGSENAAVTLDVADDGLTNAHFTHSTDWGDVKTDASGNVILDDDTVAVAEFLASQDWGDVSTDASGNVTLDNDVVNTDEMGDGDYGDFTFSSGSATLDTDSVADNEIDYTAVTLADFTDDLGADSGHTHTTTTISGLDISDDTDLVAGTNITLADDTLNVDDAFLVNDANDTTTGQITAQKGFADGTSTWADGVLSNDTYPGTQVRLTTNDLSLRAEDSVFIIPSGETDDYPKVDVISNIPTFSAAGGDILKVDDTLQVTGNIGGDGLDFGGIDAAGHGSAFNLTGTYLHIDAGTGVGRIAVEGHTCLLNWGERDAAANEHLFGMIQGGGNYILRITNDDLTTKGDPMKVDLTDCTVYLPTVYDDDIGTERDLLIQADGQLGYDSSARDKKENIVPLPDAVSEKIYDLLPRQYDKINGPKNRFGLIADEVASVFPQCVSYKREPVYDTQPGFYKEEEVYIKEYLITDVPETVNKRELVVPMLQELQKLRAEVDALKVRVAALELGG